MTPATRASGQQAQRPGRLSNGYVDLTAMPDSPPLRRRRASSSPGPSAKRAKRQADRAAATPRGDVDAAAQVQPRRERPAHTTPSFNSFTCVICMDNPTDLSATSCGHLFCHTCLMEALIAGENRTGPGEAKRSQCPVCRKVLSRSKAADIIPLLLLRRLAAQPRPKVAVASTAAVAEV